MCYAGDWSAHCIVRRHAPKHHVPLLCHDCTSHIAVKGPDASANPSHALGMTLILTVPLTENLDADAGR